MLEDATCCSAHCKYRFCDLRLQPGLMLLSVYKFKPMRWKILEKDLGCLIETSRHIALAICLPVPIKHPRSFLRSVTAACCLTCKARKKACAKHEGLKHVTDNFYRYTFLLNYIYFPFWNFRHRLVRLYVITDLCFMDTFLVAWDVAARSLLNSCFRHGQMVTSETTSPNPQRHWTQQCRNNSLS